MTGGNSGFVLRVGDTVRRTAGPWTTSVARYMTVLADAGIDQVPKHLGLDERGREVVRFVEGEAGRYPLPNWVWSPHILIEAGRVLRRMHDASVALVHEQSTWQTRVHEPAEVICHNDYAPYNMVFREHRLVGIIDFDRASPGPRLWDLAYLAYQLVPWIEGTNRPKRMQDERLALLLDAYGCDFTPSEVKAAAAERLAELAAWTEDHARQSSRPDLLEHAAMYRRDSGRLLAASAS